MRLGAHIGSCFVLLVLVGALWRITPFEVIAPDFALLFAVYLGITPRSSIGEAVAAALACGYLHDVLAGAPRGLGSFVLGAMCVLARLVTARLLVRGGLFVAVFSFVAAGLAAVILLLVRLPLDAPIGSASAELVAALGSSALTALVAPAVFRLCRTIDARFARTQREREALREGFLG